MKRFKGLRTLLLVLLCAACVMPALPAAPVKAADSADEYDALRLRWYEMLTGGDYDPADVDIAGVIGTITDKAQTNWDSMNKLQTGRTYLWSDLANGATNPTHIRLSYVKLYEMALAYRSAGSPLHGNSGLKDSVLDGLKYLNDMYYNDTVTPYGNWWEWQIGAPLALNDTVVLLYDELTASTVATYTGAIEHFVAGPRDTGANRIWSCAVALGRGILTKDGATIERAVNGLSPVFDYVAAGDGFYEDGSFIQHVKFAYNGSYGLSLIENLSTVLYFITGSSWDVTDPDSAIAYRWVDDSFIPFVYKGALMDMVRGRDISVFSREDHDTGHQMAKAILRMAQSAPAEDSARYKRMIKHWIQSDASHSFYEGMPIDFIRNAKAIVNDPAIAAASEPITSKVYPAMDRALHLRPGFGIGISMFSKRIANYETTNGQNLKGWYTGAGMTYLYTGDSGQYGGNYWPTVNSYRLPGTTAVAGKGMAAEMLNNQTWVGGTTLGNEYGVVGMALEHVDADVTSDMNAKKSWFLFDDEVVALGTGITSTYMSSDVETIVENRKLNGAGDNALTVNGAAKPAAIGWSETMTGVRWAHLAGSAPGSDIGYYFPGVATLDGLREERSGKWFDISKYTGVLEPGDPTHTNRFLNLYFNHGTAPTDASYAYALLPAKSASEVGSYAGNPDFIVLANNSGAQAVKEKRLNVIGANFWTSAEQSVDIIKSSGMASVMVKENEGSDLKLSVSDPNRPATGAVTITLAKSAKSVLSADTRITVNRLSPYVQVTIDVGGSQGRAIEAAFELETSLATHVEAENYSSMNKVTRTLTTDTGGGYHISGSDGTWMAYSGLDFGTRTDSIAMRMATANSGGTIELRLDSATGSLIGSHPVTSTGGWSTWVTTNVPLTGASGVHDLYIVYKKSNTTGVAAINWFSFRNANDTADREPPIIMLHPDTADPTDQDVSVTADIQDGSGISIKKWAYGNQPAAYFEAGGITFADRFLVTMNGTYTVYAQDLAGNKSVKTIDIWNITRGEPTILLIPNTAVPTNGNVAIAAAVSVTHGLALLKHDFGQFEDSHFASGRVVHADASEPIIMTDNGWLTVYVKDGAGNERTKQIQIGNIDRDKPVVTLNGEATIELPYNGVYHDAGAAAADALDGDITESIVVSGDKVDTSHPGSYAVHYDVTDRAGNTADQVSRIVIVAEGFDAVPPAWPAGSGANVTNIAPTSVKLSWPYASDDAGVAGYRVYNDGTELTSVAEEVTEYTANGLKPNTKYMFRITAFDKEGNENEGLTLAVYTLTVSGSEGSGGGSGGGASYVPILSSNAGLRQVELRVGGKTMTFTLIDRNGKQVYWIETDAEWTEIAANPADSSATYRLLSAAIDAVGRVQLLHGDNELMLEVKAADGTVKTYPIVIHRTMPAEPETPEGPEAPETPEEPAATFVDVAGHWAEQAIQEAVFKGIAKGYPDGSFKPDASITRAQFAVMLVQALALEDDGSELSFTDRDAIGSWARDAVSAAMSAGIVAGYADGSFLPNARVTRAEMAVMIGRALKLRPAASSAEASGTSFADDFSIPSWAKGSVAAVQGLGIVNGRSGNMFAPNETAIRAEAVVMLLRMLEQPQR
ncbi:hypothetical protein PAECIP111893_01554 [Paenibacillus plantiphilus]|uniref:S-layer homology domain-containing protein n=1 Tax=Paenibacillus plantiphilus TaxID=2905650 RepID=A0ABM9C3Z6_9BACL|nr:polysaccharide lyase family 8 super-sandwich domain-containing protein [Paenibacillus plantiphilus]CAH1200753.1 hypothetical protein PAECIP111893_01554 [Paenibacillus plantiphilus]